MIGFSIIKRFEKMAPYVIILLYAVRITTLIFYNRWIYAESDELEDRAEVQNTSDSVMFMHYMTILLLFNCNFVMSQYIAPVLTICGAWLFVGTIQGYDSSYT
jgi:Na+/H+ antiporter NhaD/arsenite permease-like protein